MAIPLGLVLGVGAAFGVNALASNSQKSDLRSERKHVTELVAEQDKALVARATDYSEDGPDLPVLEYLNLLAEGKISEAAEMAPEYSGHATELLNDTFYGKVPNRVALPRISDVTLKGSDSATVTATFELGTTGDTRDWTFDVSRSGDDWGLDNAPLTEVPLSLDRAGKVTVSGTDVTSAFTKNGSEWTGSVVLAPGVYTFAYADPGKFWSADPVTVAVPTQDPMLSVELATTISPAVVKSATKQAQDKANQWMNQCLQSRFRGPACSKDAREEGDYIIGKAITGLYVDTYPTIELQWNSSKGVFTYTAHGKVRSEGITTDRTKGSRWAYNDFHGTVKWNPNGTITMTLVRDD